MTYANGQVRIQSAIPEKAEYAVGDVVTLRFRMESTAQAPARTIDASSTTLANVDSCDWAGTFPAGIGGKFECARIQGGTQYPAVTYTVTEADAQAGPNLFAAAILWTTRPGNGLRRPGTASTSPACASLSRRSSGSVDSRATHAR